MVIPEPIETEASERSAPTVTSAAARQSLTRNGLRRGCCRLRPVTQLGPTSNTETVAVQNDGRRGVKEKRSVPKYEGRLELTWTNKDQCLLAQDDGSYEWLPPSDLWWEHPEAVVRLTALWLAWEGARLTPAGMLSWLRDADTNLDRLTAGTFAQCAPPGTNWPPRYPPNCHPG